MANSGLCMWLTLLTFGPIFISSEAADGGFLVLGVATEETSGFRRFHNSATLHGLPLHVLGSGEKWRGEGFRLSLLRAELEKYKDEQDKIVLVADAYDVLFNAGTQDILANFKNTKANILFASDSFCWPDKSLAVDYDPVSMGKKYLNSGLFIGYAPALYKMISSSSISPEDSDQLFFTKIYVDDALKEELNIKIDHRSTLFQTMHGVTETVQITFKGKTPQLKNTEFNTMPLIIHANGPAKVFQKTLATYVLNHWNPEDGCLSSSQDTKDMNLLELKDYPTVMIGVFIEQPTPFLDEFFQKLLNLEYPKDKIHLFIHNAAKYHSDSVDIFIEKNSKRYKSIRVILELEFVKEREARNMAIDECIKRSCDYFFNVDSVAHVDNPKTLKLLMEQNRPVVAPMMVLPGKNTANFWNSITEGHAARSSDFNEIVNNNQRCLWSVPHVQSCYLVRGDVIHEPNTKPSYAHTQIQDAETALCANFRDRDVDMFVSNLLDFGHLISVKDFNLVNKEFFELEDNSLDWEKRYLHADYRSLLDKDSPVSMPCPDVYYVPLTNNLFCDELLYRLKQNNKATSKKNAVKTSEIHLDHIGLAVKFQSFVHTFLYPFQNRVFDHYKGLAKVMRSIVVQYGPNDHPDLQQYFSTSVYVVHIALSQPGIDYQGGGYNFTRYECNIENIPQGWMVMHPGRLTHFHEDLKTTSGTRYVLVGYIDF